MGTTTITTMTLGWIQPVLASVAREDLRYVTELRHVPEGWPAVGGMALLGLLLWAVVWMYRHEGRVGASGRVRGFLAAVRCLILLALAVILLEPVRVKILRRWIDSYTIVLVDNSSSMGLVDNYRDPDTADRVRRLVGADQPAVARAELVTQILRGQDNLFLRELAENNRLKIYTFSDEAELQGIIRAAREQASTTAAKAQARAAPPGELPPEGVGAPLIDADQLGFEIKATGPATNLERAFRRAVESVASAPIAAVVVMTDGAFNQGAPAEEIARYASDRRIPLHVIGLGDPSAPRNIRVVEVLAPENVFQKDPFGITANLVTEGVSGEQLTVTLRERDAGAGSERVLQTKQVRVGPGGATEPVQFQREPERVGRFVYTVAVDPLPDETVAEDNSRQAAVSVIDARTRVLLVAGGPSWNYSYVTHLLERDETFDVSCWLQSADHSAVRDGDTVIDHLPSTVEELFAYDAILLVDPHPDELTEDWARAVDRLVSEQGGGLLYLASRTFSPEFLRTPRLKPLHDLLPIIFDPEAELILNQIGHYQLSPSGLEIPDAAYDHPVMRLHDDPASNRLTWNGIGDVFWHMPVLREKPVAQVLLRHGNPRMRNSYGGHVLAAVQYVGGGRSGFLAFDSVWRWRRHGEGYYDRFWIQLIRYLAEGKRLGGSNRATLIVENEQPSLGEAVTVSARLLDASFAPLRRDEVVARFQVENDRGELLLSARPDRAGWFEGRFIPDRIGTYRVSLPVPYAKPGDAQEVGKDLVVSRPNLELLHPQMNKPGLTVLAERSHRGRLWPVDEARDLPKAIPDFHEEIPIRSRPVTLWDNWLVMTGLVFLLALEWGVRKWNRLL